MYIYEPNRIAKRKIEKTPYIFRFISGVASIIDWHEDGAASYLKSSDRENFCKLRSRRDGPSFASGNTFQLFIEIVRPWVAGSHPNTFNSAISGSTIMDSNSCCTSAAACAVNPTFSMRFCRRSVLFMKCDRTIRKASPKSSYCWSESVRSDWSFEASARSRPSSMYLRTIV